MKSEDIIHIAKEYREKLSAVLGRQLLDVRLYGSQARNTAKEFSDIDILCVLQSPFDYAEMIRQTSEITAKISLDYDVVLSRMFVSEQNFKTGKLPFIMNVQKESMTL